MQPLDEETMKPRQPTASNMRSFDRLLVVDVGVAVSCCEPGAKIALSKRIAIWPPLAATAFGVSVMQITRVVQVGTPLWPIYRRTGRTGLTKSVGNTICAGLNIVSGVCLRPGMPIF